MRVSCEQSRNQEAGRGKPSRLSRTGAGPLLGALAFTGLVLGFMAPIDFAPLTGELDVLLSMVIFVMFLVALRYVWWGYFGDSEG